MKPLAASAPDNLALAITSILLTVLALSFGDALIKLISANFVLWQVFVLRSLLAIPALAAVIRLRNRSASLRPRHLGWTALRSLMLTFMWVAYYAALPHLALSVAAAAYYTLPLFITLFAALFIGDKVGARGWAAVLVGFCGMLLILRPQTEAFNAYALLPLVSAALYALAMILTRTKCKNESPLVLSFSLNLSFVGVGLAATFLVALAGAAEGRTRAFAFLLGPWAPMGASEWGAMALLASLVIVGSVGAAIAYQAGPPAVVATFDFAYIAFATGWGLIFFSEVPDVVTLAGMALIIMAGMLSLWQGTRA
ncbi:MAG: DMT family transporter [Kiloniellaceae bacterium]